MLYLEIRKGKEAMKSSDFQQQIGWTAATINRTTKATKGFVQMSSKYTFFDDSWFRGVKTAEEEMDEVVDYCRPLKTSHKGFFLDTLKKLKSGR